MVRELQIAVKHNTSLLETYYQHSGFDLTKFELIPGKNI